jgi:hypothetical protein
MCLQLRSRGAPARYGEDVRQWLNATYLRRWTGRRGPIAWPTPSPGITLIRFLKWRSLKKHVYAVPPRTFEDLVDSLQAAMTTADANMLRRVRENTVRALPSAFKLKEVASNTNCNCEELMVC